MGYWNNGMLEYWVWRNEIYFYIVDIDQKLKTGHHPLFIPNIPFFQYSIIPLVIYRHTPPLLGEIKAGSSESGFFTLVLRLK
jgi:hypothetical protein